MKRKQRAIKEFNIDDYDFSDCVEITGDALYLINGGGTTTESKSNSGSSQGSGKNGSSGGGNEIDNSHEAVANAKPGDYFYRDDGTKQVVNAGDIAYEKNYLQNSGNNDKATQTPETTTVDEASHTTMGDKGMGRESSSHKGSGNDTYTVNKGDTLSKIVYDHNKKYGTNLTVENVAKKNGIKDPNKIYCGQQINLGSSQTVETQKPTTKRSETFTVNNQIISKENGITTAPEGITGTSLNGDTFEAKDVSVRDVATKAIPTQGNDENTVTVDNLNSASKSETINWRNEILECINSVQVGLRKEIEVNFSKSFHANAYVDLMSVSLNDGDNEYSQGIGASLYLKVGKLTFVNFSADYSRKGKESEGYNCPLSLFGEDFKFSRDLDSSPAYDVTPPISGISASINLQELEDLYKKSCYALETNLFKVFSEEKR